MGDVAIRLYGIVYVKVFRRAFVLVNNLFYLMLPRY
jgi:hypothetical protein